jgi:hemolysin activation/secretion protein
VPIIKRINQTLLCLIALAQLCTVAFGQNPEPAQPAAAATPATAHPLKQILIAETAEAAQQMNFLPGKDFVVVASSLKNIDGGELAKRLIAAKDRNIDKPLLDAITPVLSTYARQKGYLIVEINIPSQSIADGAVRFAIVPGKFRQIKFVGNRWFTESQLLGNLQVNRGEIVRVPELDAAVSWTNDSNPFRRIQAHVEQVGNSNEADLVIGVQERSPLRVVASADNAGNEALGKEHYTLAATYANLWKLDHSLTYQYITTSRGQYFQGHVLNYRAPLPWHHFVQLNTSYMRATPVLFGGYFNQNAESVGADLRYVVPFKKADNPGEYFANISFKDSNNDLQFGGFSVQSSKVDVFELTVGASKVYRDKRGAWILGFSVTGSPGKINSRNSDATFENARGGAKSSYAYGSFSFQRGLTLDRGWEFISRGNLQLAGGNLISSEQLTIGGASTVRGFDENIFAGDQGFVFDNELIAPTWRRPFSIRGKNFVPVETRFLAFYDAAAVRNVHSFSFDPKFHPLASTGFGVRVNWANVFSLSADYGWQITHLPYAVTEHGRGHVKVTLAY